MQKNVREIMSDVECAKAIQRIIEDGGSLDNMKYEISTILDDYLDILLDAKVKI